MNPQKVLNRLIPQKDKKKSKSSYHHCWGWLYNPSRPFPRVNSSCSRPGTASSVGSAGAGRPCLLIILTDHWDLIGLNRIDVRYHGIRWDLLDWEILGLCQVQEHRLPAEVPVIPGWARWFPLVYWRMKGELTGNLWKPDVSWFLLVQFPDVSCKYS